jgi:hypothetical protein
MLASRRVLLLALAFLSSFAAAQPSDQLIAKRVLGAQWKQLSRRAGIIFAGTVLSPATQTVTNQTAALDRLVSGATPTVQLSFHVDEAIAGVERGQTLTIHEWSGAWSRQPPMSKGQHFLIFLYPPSRLGLTSPVGGALGQVALEPSGQNVANVFKASLPAAPLGTPLGTRNIPVVQLERAIRAAREE